MKFSATVEILTKQNAAIVALFDSTGEWAGASRITLPRSTNPKHDLYEYGYTHASQMAAVKGGTLNTYRKET